MILRMIGIINLLLILSSTQLSEAVKDDVINSEYLTETTHLILDIVNNQLGLADSEAVGIWSNTIVNPLKCIFTEITLPTVEKIKKNGPYSYGKYLLSDAFRTFLKEMNLNPGSSVEDYEDSVLGVRLQDCISGNQKIRGDMEWTGRQHGGGYGHKGGYKSSGHDPILGFALLGLKVVGGLAAFLAWDLFNTR